MKFFRKRKFFSFMIAICISTCITAAGFPAAVQAETIDYRARAEAQKLAPVESNAIENWPQGPAVSARSAILMEAGTGTILYAKNIHEHLYPASTTKILTAYIARQIGNLEDMVSYSPAAVNSIKWWEDSNIGIKAGESITLEQSLYGLLVGSGNECGNAIGEHLSGSMEAFVKRMNETAKKLGCTDSNFVTTNGIHDDDHYTSAHDLAVIGRHFFADDLLCKMSSQRSYLIPASATLSQDLTPVSKNLLFAGQKYAYEYLVGSKTGYTGQARQNLVSCAEKDGLKLICVVMGDESPMQYTDTVDLFNYGFSNFKAVNAAEHDTTYSADSSSFFMSGNAMFQDNTPILSLDRNAYLVLPSHAEFAEVTSELSYETTAENEAAVVRYSYNGQPVGSAAILLSDHVASFDFSAQPADRADAKSDAEAKSNAEAESNANAKSDTNAESNATAKSDANAESNAEAKSDADAKTSSDAKSAKHAESVIFLNIRHFAMWGLGLLALLIALLVIRSVLRDRSKSRRRRAIMDKRRKKKNQVIDFDRYTDQF